MATPIGFEPTISRCVLLDAIARYIYHGGMSNIDRRKRAIPTGECWCGCGEETPNVRAFFIKGHDRVAEAAVIMEAYGGVPQFLLEHGYGPGGRNPRRTWETLRGRRPA